MKRDKIIYYLVTALASLPILGGSIMYFVKTADVQAIFTSLGYPSYLVIPLAILKILGLVAVWSRLSARLKEWAYVGFFINTALASVAHYHAGDGSFVAIIALVLWSISYALDKRVFGKALV